MTHPWTISPKDAHNVQEVLNKQVRTRKLPAQIHTIAGLDVAYSPENNMLIAGLVILDYPSLLCRAYMIDIDEIKYPYYPGLLSFREGPSLLKLIKGCKYNVDIFIFDGHGIAHPRGLGIASHIGVLINKPTIGCAKKRLIGKYNPIKELKGASSDLIYKNKIVGKVLRTRTNVKPVFISVGNLLILDQATSFILNCTRTYRLPEPVRQAHLLVNRYKKFIFN